MGSGDKSSKPMQPPAPKLIQQLSGNTFITESTEDTEKERENAISVFSSVLSVSSVFKSLSANHF